MTGLIMYILFIFYCVRSILKLNDNNAISRKVCIVCVPTYTNHIDIT